MKQNESPAKKQKTDQICPTCNKLFGNKYSLNMHIATVHEKSKQFVCDSCSKSFPRKDMILKTVAYLKFHYCTIMYSQRIKSNVWNII